MPAGTAPTAAPASSMSPSATSPGSVGDSPPPHAQPASAQPLRQPSSNARARSGSRYQSEEPVAKYAFTTSGSAPAQQRSLTIAATVS